MHDVAGLKFPLEVAGLRVERVDVIIAAAEIDDACGNGWRREENVKGIGHHFGAWDRSVNAGRGETSLTFGLETPLFLAGLGLDRVEVAVQAVDVDQPTGDGGGRIDGTVGRELPALGPVSRVYGVEIVIATANVDHAA